MPGKIALKLPLPKTSVFTIYKIGASLWLVPPKHHHVNHHFPHFPHSHGHKKSHGRNVSGDISKSHNLDTVLSTLITSTIPAAVPADDEHSNFVPHITLTSDIDLSTLKPSPEKWLERLAVPQVADIRVMFKEIDTGSTFTKKVYLRVHKAGIEGLAELARWQGVEGGSTGPVSGGGDDGKEVGDTDAAEKWIDGWDPHVSLL
jgi:hypothetical protein